MAAPAALPCELTWATAWEDDANIEIAPRVGLPQLPVVNWAAGSPFAWVDDEDFAALDAWLRAAGSSNRHAIHGI